MPRLLRRGRYPMRILHVAASQYLMRGGVVTGLQKLISAQQRHGMDVSLACTFQSGETFEVAETLRREGVRVELYGPTYHPRIKWRPGLHGKLYRFMEGCAVVHLHAVWEEIQHQAARAATRRGIPFVVSPHGMLDPWSLRQSRRFKQVYWHVRLKDMLHRSELIHYTAALERDLAAPLQLPDRSVVIPNGIDLSEFEHLPPKGEFRARYDTLKGKRIILFLSRLHPKKGLDLLIPAFARAKLDDCALVLAGPTSTGYEKTVDHLIVAHHLENRVVRTGMLHGLDRLRAYVDADLFVLASYQENFAIAVMESLAAGTPVLISDRINTYPEILAADVGWVAPLEVHGLAQMLARIMGDDQLRAAAGSRAPALVRRSFDWNQIAMEWRKQYMKLAEGR